MLARRISISTPRARAPSCKSFNCVSAVGNPGLERKPIFVPFGTNSRKRPRRFAPISLVKILMPVELPPGREKLAASPSPTSFAGSALTTNTIGIADVAALAATPAGSPPVATRTATRRSTSSAANAGRRSYSPAAQRYSIAMFCPSTYPLSARPLRKPATRCAVSPSDRLLRNPITGIGGCWVRAASGQTNAVPPRMVMNSRRLMSASQSGGAPTGSMAQKNRFRYVARY